MSNLVDKHPCWLPPLASLYKENWNIVIYQTNQYIALKFILNIWKNLWAQITSSWLWPRNQINDQHLWDPESIKIHERQVHPPCEAHGQWQTPFQSCRQGALAWTTSPSCQRLSRQWAWSGSTLCSSSDCISTSRFCSSVSFLGPRTTWQGFPPVLRVNDSNIPLF